MSPRIVSGMARVMAIVLAVAALLTAPWRAADAQTNTARISGTVTGEGGSPAVGATVTARSINTNLTRSAVTSDRGFYVLAGLPPDEYELSVRRIGLQPQTRRLRAQIGQTLSIDFALEAAAAQLGTVQVVATAPEEETRSTEVATNISTEQIENLPVSNRNFLEFATLAPGVVPGHDRNGITAGGQSQNLTNVYVDGASYKNEVLQGGVAGQDASTGNPFPQSAVQEFRVISQQYKAEYAKATAVIVTATTKSGSNEFHGDVFYYGQNEKAIGRDYFQRENAVTLPNVGRNHFGGSVGGPIVRDRLFFFLSGEANHRDEAVNVNTPNTAGLPQNVIDDLAGIGGTFDRPLRSNLFFGKLTYNPAERHRFEASLSVRDEYETRGFGGNTSFESGEYFNNDVYTGLVKHQYTRGNLLNEAHFDYQRYQWKPIAFVNEVGRSYSGLGRVGGRNTQQDFQQNRFTVRNDLTYTLPEWFGTHIFKGGANVSHSQYDITRELFGNPEFRFRATENYEIPYEAEMGVGDPRVVTNNTQIGLYAQNDWNITPRFLLSLGVRWDYESDMRDNDWVTPDSVRDEIEDYFVPVPGWEGKTTERFFSDPGDRKPFMGAIQPRLGFSWEVEQLANATLHGGAGIYYDREYYGIGIGERLNVSYPRYRFRFSETGGVVGGNETIAWDPSYLSREGLLGIIEQGESSVRPELPMLPNELPPPKAYQWSAGVRKAFGRYRVSASYSGVRGYNKITYLHGNKRPNGTCCLNSATWGTVLLAEPVGKSRYNGLYLTLDRPFLNQGRWSWGGTINYTLSEAEATIPVSSNFSLHVYTPDELVWQPDDTDERHRVVANYITLLPFDVRFSGIVTLGSGRPFNVFIGSNPAPELCAAFDPGSSCGGRTPAGEEDPTIGGNSLTDDFPAGYRASRNAGRPPRHDFIIPNAWAYRNVNIRLQKDFPFRDQQLSIIGELFNVFDFDNFDSFSTNKYNAQIRDANRPRDPYINYLTPVLNFGEATGVVNNSSRRFQLGLKYSF